MSSSLDATQARIDAHLQSVHRCLVHPTSQLSALLAEEDTTDCIEAFDKPSSRIAAKVTHLQKNRIAALSTIPATTESDQSSLFDLFFSGVDLLWGDGREHDKHDTSKTPDHPQNRDSPAHRHSQEHLFPTSGHRHRRAGSSKI